MKNWRIHTGWAIATVLAAGVSARVAVRRDPTAPASSAPAPAARAAHLGSFPPAASKTDLPRDDGASPAPPPAPAFGDLPVEDRIRALIQTCENYNEFQEAMKAVTDREALLRLAREALAGKNPTSVNWFLNNLQMMKGREVAEILESYLKKNPDSDDGSAAARALGHVGDPGSLGPLNDALRSKNEEVRFASARSLWQLGFGAPMEEVLSTLRRQFESSDGGMRREAVERMLDLNPLASVPLFARALQDSNGDVRLAALQAFSTFGGPEYSPLVAPLTNDPNARVANLARELLEALKNDGK
jgi:HEAT repeat protein